MSAGAEFAKWLGQALVVGIGWLVVHRLSRARDIDKSRREIVAKSVDELTKSTSELLIEACDYHTGERVVSNELSIKMRIQDLGIRVASLSEVCKDEASLAPCRAEIAGLRRAITGSHFEDEHTGPLVETDSQFQSIAEAVLRMKRSLLKLKHRQFPSA